jgi:hypothetical protein
MYIGQQKIFVHDLFTNQQNNQGCITILPSAQSAFSSEEEEEGFLVTPSMIIWGLQII